MTDETVKKLNQLNKDFYQKVGKSFSSTRQQAWDGWKKCWEIIGEDLQNDAQLSICDVGCGNGRFADFCERSLRNKPFIYLGIDNNSTLLSETQGHERVIKQLDVVEVLQSNQGLTWQKFSLAVSFGVMHHIPSKELRIRFMQNLSNLLKPNGFLIITFWQFPKNENLMSRQQSAEELGFDRAELEENDFFLTWDKEVKATRYCHFVDKAEQQELIAASDLKVVTSFSADGKTGEDNDYVILQKR